MLKKLTIITAILFTFLTSSPVFAVDASSQIPELNPFCWHRSDCQTTRKQFGGTGAGDEGFITAGVDPCTGGGDKGSPEEWGRCLPAGTSKTEISFGGKSEFSNIGEFIVLMYKYLLTIASIVAVVMVIIAGAQWITSGGNSEAIGSAKKRIGGALIGLFIAYMSYFVLNTINPALVNLRLPQVWLVRPQALMTEFCSDLKGANEGKIKFALVATKAEPNKLLPPANERKYEQPSLPLKQECGSRWLAESGGESTCRGNDCSVGVDGQQACFDYKGDRTGYNCGNVIMGGNISYSAPIRKGCGGVFQTTLERGVGLALDVFGDWACDPPLVKSELDVVCENPEKLGVFEEEQASGHTVVRSVRWQDLGFGVDPNAGDGHPPTRYRIEGKIGGAKTFADSKCNGEYGKPRGFVLAVKLAEETIGRNRWTWHFIGRHGEDLGNLNFWAYANKINQNFLFSVDEIEKGGVSFNFDLAGVAPVASVAVVPGTFFVPDVLSLPLVDRYRKYFSQ